MPDAITFVRRLAVTTVALSAWASTTAAGDDWPAQQAIQDRVLDQQIEAHGDTFELCARLRNVDRTTVFETNTDDQLVVHVRASDGRYDLQRPDGFVPRMTPIPFPTMEERFYSIVESDAFIEKCRAFRFDDLEFEDVVIQSFWNPGLYQGAPLPDRLLQDIASGVAGPPLQGDIRLSSNLCRASKATRDSSCEASIVAN